jgi:hypothetical protein
MLTCPAQIQAAILRRVQPFFKQAGARRRAPQARTFDRRGGTSGGRAGCGRGSIAGLRGSSRVNGLMMIGGIVGGADGGPFWLLAAHAATGPDRRRLSYLIACMASPGKLGGLSV